MVKLKLNTYIRDSNISFAPNFNKCGCRPSGPIALLLSRDLISWSISSATIGQKKNDFLAGEIESNLGKELSNFSARLFPIEAK